MVGLAGSAPGALPLAGPLSVWFPEAPPLQGGSDPKSSQMVLPGAAQRGPCPYPG